MSKAFSVGLPTIMSSFTADSLGIPEEDGIGCVAKTAKIMKQHILNFYLYESIWDRARERQLEFVQETTEIPDYAIKALNNTFEVNLQKIRNARIIQSEMHCKL